MFKKIEILLSGPICSCGEQNLAWSPVEANSGLKIWCADCKTQVFVPREKFVASFKLDVPYPGKKEADKDWALPTKYLDEKDKGKPN